MFALKQILNLQVWYLAEISVSFLDVPPPILYHLLQHLSWGFALAEIKY